MGFFTDSDKREDQTTPGFFKGFNHGQNNGDSENKFFMASHGSSIQKVCKTDPKDNNYMICTVKEKKLANENGENKYVTEEREEREPVGNGFSQFPNIFGSFENSFNHRNFKQNHQNIDDDETFKEFEESQHFLDFMPKIWSFFKGNGSSEDNKKNEFQKSKNLQEHQIDPFFDVSFFFPSVFFRDSWYHGDDPFNQDGFFNNHHPNYDQKDFNRNNYNPFNQNLYHNDNQYNKKPKSNQYNRQYSYPNSHISNNNSDDIYDL